MDGKKATTDTNKKSFLNILNARRFKTAISILKMDIVTKYKILSAKKVKTRYGERVVLELENFALFLPASYIPLFNEKIMCDMEKSKNYYVSKNNDGFSVRFDQYDDDDEESGSDGYKMQKKASIESGENDHALNSK